MTAKGWYVVHFLDENLVEIVPSNWLINFKKCLWPIGFGAQKIMSAIKNSIKPQNNWRVCSIKVLSKSIISDFNQATKTADMAQFTSDIETIQNQDNESSLKRKRKPNKKYTNTVMSSSDSEVDISHENLPDFPRIQSISSQNKSMFN